MAAPLQQLPPSIGWAPQQPQQQQPMAPPVLGAYSSYGGAAMNARGVAVGVGQTLLNQVGGGLLGPSFFEV